MLGLRWCDVDLKGAQLHIVQTLVEVDHHPRVALPKTDRSRRTVSLDAKTVEVLSESRAVEELHSGFSEGNLVFATSDGQPIHPAAFSYAFQRRLKVAGLRRIRLHDLRHTHATHALQVGVHPKVVSERLGHSSATITLDVYSHVLPSLQREAAEAVAALVAADSAGGRLVS